MVKILFDSLKIYFSVSNELKGKEIIRELKKLNRQTNIFITIISEKAQTIEKLIKENIFDKFLMPDVQRSP